MLIIISVMLSGATLALQIILLLRQPESSTIFAYLKDARQRLHKIQTVQKDQNNIEKALYNNGQDNQQEIINRINDLHDQILRENEKNQIKLMELMAQSFSDIQKTHKKEIEELQLEIDELRRADDVQRYKKEQKTIDVGKTGQIVELAGEPQRQRKNRRNNYAKR